MKNSTIIYKLIILILAILNVFQAFLVYQFKNNSDHSVKKSFTADVIDSLSVNDTVLLNEIFEIAERSSDKKINTNVRLLTSYGDTLSLSELLGDKAKLVFDFEHIGCKTCFDQEMNRIINYSGIIGQDNIIYISKYQSKREWVVLEKKYGISIYSKEVEKFGLPVEDGYYPYIFVIDDNAKSQGLYIPTTLFYSMGNLYYSIVYNKYFNPSDTH